MPKILTTDGDYKNVEDIQNPDDECVDPSEYWDIVTTPNDPEDEEE